MVEAISLFRWAFPVADNDAVGFEPRIFPSLLEHAYTSPELTFQLRHRSRDPQEEEHLEHYEPQQHSIPTALSFCNGRMCPFL